MTFLQALVKITFKVKPTDDEAFFGLTLLYARMVGDKQVVPDSFGYMHLALYPVSVAASRGQLQTLTNILMGTTLTKRSQPLDKRATVGRCSL